MPRRILKRSNICSVSQENDLGTRLSRRQKLGEVGGWSDAEIDKFFIDSRLPEGRSPNIAFFAILIYTIEDSDQHHLCYDLPGFIEGCGLPLPDKISSFVRFIRRSVDKAFRKQRFGDLSVLPSPLHPKSSVIGPICEAAGITEDWLFSAKTRYSGQAPVTIGLILELIAVKKRKRVTDVECAEWVQRLLGLSYIPYHGTIQRQWGRIAQHAAFLHCKVIDRAAYLLKPYLLSSKSKLKHVPEMDRTKDDELVAVQSQKLETCFLSDSQTQTLETSLEVLEKQSGRSPLSLKELAQTAFDKTFECVVNQKMKILSELNSTITVAQHSIVESQTQLDKINQRVGHYKPVNTFKRDQRAKATRDKLVDCEKEVKGLGEKIVSLSEEKTNALKLASKWRVKAKSMADKLHTSVDTSDCPPCDTCIKNKQTLAEMSEHVNYLEHENIELMDHFNSTVMSSDSNDHVSLGVVKTKACYDGRHLYSDPIRLVYMQLLSLGVAVGKCSEVVRTVVEGLTDFKIDMLPSKSTTSSFQSECETLGQIHVANVMLQSANITVQLDGSKKKFKEYSSFQVTRSLDSDSGAQRHERETLSIGIQEMAKGDADSFLSTFMLICQNLAETFSDDKDTISEVQSKLVASIKNLMTDRHVVNKSFKEKLENTRKELFEKYLEGYKTMTPDMQKQLAELHGLFCGLHVLSNMGTAAGKALKVFEEISLPEGMKISDNAFQKGNSRTFDLIFELSQSLTVSGSQRSGRFADWDAYLKGKEKTNRLLSFLRHRFNVLFVNGAGAYYHKEDIKDFLKHEKMNKMLNCITDSVNSPVCIAALRALGIFAVLITQPLWRVVEREDIHVFDLNQHWLHLMSSLDEYSNDCSELLAGNPMFPDFPAKKDEVYEELFRPTTCPLVEKLTKDCLELICFHTHTLVKRQLADQLPGGKFATPSPETVQQTMSAPTTNRAGEKDFSDLDREIKRAPQRLTSHISATISFRNNKTLAYLNKLPPYTRRLFIKRGIKLAPKRRLQNQVQTMEVKRIRLKAMEEQKHKAELTKQRALNRVSKITEGVTSRGGAWKSKEEMDDTLKMLNKGQEQAVKDQILYQTVVLKKPLKNKKLGHFSEKGRKFSLQELKGNFCEILTSSSSVCNGTSTTNSTSVRSDEERSLLLKSHMEEFQKTEMPMLKTKSKTKSQPKNPMIRQARTLVKAAKRTLAHSDGTTELLTIPAKKAKPEEDFSFQFKEDMVGHEFVVVAFNEGWFLGQVVDFLSDKEANVKFMKRVGHCLFKWDKEVSSTGAEFIIYDGVKVDSASMNSLRTWKIPGEDFAEIERRYQVYSEQYF